MDSFSTALVRAEQAHNTLLQFQACEGLGSINHQLGRLTEAAACFRQALGILDQIRQDTGIARERVMEKLSETLEALQAVTPTLAAKEIDVEALSTDEEETQEREATRSKLHSIASTEEKPGSSLQGGGPGGKISLTERRGAKSLPPLKRAAPPTHSRHTPIPLPSKKGKGKMTSQEEEERQSSDYSADLQAYMNSYADSTNTTSSWSQDFQHHSREPPAATPTAARAQSVREGSLAVGADARKKFGVQTVEEWRESKGGKRKLETRSQIIQLAPSTSSSSSGDTHMDQAEQGQRSTAQPSANQSKVCTIL